MTLRLTLILFIVAFGIRGFTQFVHPPYKQYTLRDGLSQMQVISLFQDSRGYIWAGTKEGINCFNGEKIINFTSKDGLANDYILQITEDSKGNIWVSTFKGYWCFNGQKWESYLPPNYQQGCLAPTTEAKLWYIYQDQQTKTHLGYFENGKFHDQPNLLPQFDVRSSCCIAYSEESKALIVSDNHHVYELKNGEINQLLSTTDHLTIEQKWKSILIYQIDQKSQVTLFEYENGKLRKVAIVLGNKTSQTAYANQSYTFHPPLSDQPIYAFKSNTLTKRGFPGISINCYLEDRDRHLWIGAEDGLYRIFTGEFETFKRDVLPSVWSTVEDLNGHIWLASYEYGLKKFDGRKIHNFSIKETGKHGKRFLFHPSVDKRGKIYFPCETGVLTYDGHQFGHLDGENCMTTFYDRHHDQLWVGSYKLVNVYDKNLNLIRSIKPENGLGPERYVLTISRDKDGYYWLGESSGICRYNYNMRKSVNYNRTNGRLPANGVMSIYTTADGRTWFGSTNGLLYYENETDSIKRIDQEELAGTVGFVTSIDSTWLVFSQSTGIYLMNLKKFNSTGKVELHLFNQHNGFFGIDPGQDGAMVDSKGNIWITSSTEVTKLDPLKLDFKSDNATVRIKAFDNEKLPYNCTQINLARNNRSAVFQFDAACFNRPAPVMYSWKIKGEGNEWSAWQAEDYAVLSNLHDGSSTFLVRIKVPGLPDIHAQTSILVNVNLAVGKQEWFFPTLLVFVSLLVILAIVLLIQTRTKMLQINKQAKTFQLQAVLSQMNPHFIFNVMASLQSMILSANIEKANDYLVRMSNLVRKFLEASISTSSARSKKLENGEMPLNSELEILQSFIEFQQLIHPSRFEYQLTLDPLINPEKVSIPPMLIQPFVENSIRHGLLQKQEKGLLQIKISIDKNDRLLIVISDNGIGMERACEIIGKSPLLYTSRGRELTEKRIKLLNEMGYQISYQTNSSDQGTDVTLIINTYESRNISNNS